MWLCKPTRQDGRHIIAEIGLRYTYGMTISNDNSNWDSATLYKFVLEDETTKRRLEWIPFSNGSLKEYDHFNFPDPTQQPTPSSLNFYHTLPSIQYDSKTGLTPRDLWKIEIRFNDNLDTGGVIQFLNPNSFYTLSIYYSNVDGVIYDDRFQECIYHTRIFCTDQEVNPSFNRPYSTNENITENTTYSKQPSYITL